MIDIRIRISKSICTVVFLAVFFRCGADMIMAYTAAFIHELAHFAMCRRLNVRVYAIKLGALGMRLDTAYISDSSKLLCISAAGPLMSFLLFWISAIAAVAVQNMLLLFRFAFFNLCIAMINILPIMPLDGGVMLKAFLIYRNGIIYGHDLSRKITLYVLSVVSLAGVWFVCKGYVSISFAVVILFLMIFAKKEDVIGLFGKQEVYGGNCTYGNKLRYISIDYETRILNLASRIGNGFFLVAAVFKNGKFAGEINQNEIISCINKYGVSLTAGECLQNKIQKKKSGL